MSDYRDIQFVRVCHHSDGEGTLQLLGHARQRSKRQLPGCFEELHGDVTDGFDLGGRQVMLTTEPLVDLERAAGVISDAGGIGASFLEATDKTDRISVFSLWISLWL